MICTSRTENRFLFHDLDTKFYSLPARDISHSFCFYGFLQKYVEVLQCFASINSVRVLQMADLYDLHGLAHPSGWIRVNLRRL